ncbi:MAG TPA: carboxypeptidase regulatory-like domain-containing protein [Thermoanaerobaculia bacterium]|nr:carboxypeptidase regulatory-like domain-containing protein [Thermoanaerobaculia bacterium]
MRRGLRRCPRRVAVALVLAVSPWPLAAAEVAGTVTAPSSVRPKPPPRYYMGPERSGRGATGARGGVEDVVVWLEGVDGEVRVEPPPPPAVMRQLDEAFLPHVLPVRAGGAVEFPNDDDYYHNVFSVMAGDRFDLGRYARGESSRQTFTTSGVVVVRCEIHPGMKAFVRVLDGPAFTVPAADGGFLFSGLAAGTYTVRAWHPTAGERSHTVTVAADGTARVALDF